MAERYATIVTDDDGNEIVSSIALLESKPDDPGAHAKRVKVPGGVKIGMVKGGPLDSVGGYGFPDGSGLSNASPKLKDKAKDGK